MQMTLASSSSRDWRAVKRSWQSAARTPRILLAAMDTPAPLPQMSTPRSALPVPHRGAHGAGEVGVVGGRGRSGCRVDELVALGRQRGADHALVGEPAMIAADARCACAQRPEQRGGGAVEHPHEPALVGLHQARRQQRPVAKHGLDGLAFSAPDTRKST